MNRRDFLKAGLIGAALAATPAGGRRRRPRPSRDGRHVGRAGREQLREGLAKLRGCHVEVYMHEPMTVHHEIKRIAKWAEIALQEAERAAT
jgi:hypothetical protein